MNNLKQPNTLIVYDKQIIYIKDHLESISPQNFDNPSTMICAGCGLQAGEFTWHQYQTNTIGPYKFYSQEKTNKYCPECYNINVIKATKQQLDELLTTAHLIFEACKDWQPLFQQAAIITTELNKPQ